MGQKISRRLIAYFLDNPNIEINARDLKSEFNISDQQLSSSISYIRNQDWNGARVKLQTIVPGTLWMWHQNGADKSESRPLYEHLATTRTGDILVQDEDGAVYKLTEL